MPYSGKKRKKTRTQKTEDGKKEKAPQSIVAKKGSVGLSVQELIKNMRAIMSPNTAVHLSERRTNSIKDYINIAGPYGVNHIVVFTKMKSYPRMRIGCFPQGPTLHFRVEEYMLTRDLLKVAGKGIDIITPFFDPPVLILNNFPENNKPLQLVCKTFQNMFPAINPETIKVKHCRRALMLQYEPTSNSIIIRHYSVKLDVAGVSKAMNGIVSKKVLPDMSKMNDISEYFINKAEGEEFDFDEGDSLSGMSESSTAGGPVKQSVKLVELGPRMRIQLLAVENGLFQGEYLYNVQTKEEMIDSMKEKQMEKILEKKGANESMKDDEKREKMNQIEKDKQKSIDKERDLRKKEKKEKMEKREADKKKKAKEAKTGSK